MGIFSFLRRYYSATILQMAGVRDDKIAIWLAAATAFTNFLFTLVGVWLVERVGRRKLTLGSIVGEGTASFTTFTQKSVLLFPLVGNNNGFIVCCISEALGPVCRF